MIEKDFIEKNGLYEIKSEYDGYAAWATSYFVNDTLGKMSRFDVELLENTVTGHKVLRMYGGVAESPLNCRYTFYNETVDSFDKAFNEDGPVFRRLYEFCLAFKYDLRCMQCVSLDMTKHREIEIPRGDRI